MFQNENPDNGPTLSGTGDFALTTKYAFMNIGGSDYHASLKFEVKFPTASVGINKNQSDGFTVYQPSLSLAKDFTGNNSQMFTQVGGGRFFYSARRFIKETSGAGRRGWLCKSF
jgi:hypothetical protein